MSDLRGSDRKPLDFIVQTEPIDPVYECAAGRVTLGPYEPGDEEAILTCFREVFDVERSLEQWNWEFRDNPNGMRVFISKLDDGAVMSQFCTLPSKVKVGDGVFSFGEAVDSMVHPRAREGLKKRGLFAKTLLSHSYAHGKRDDELVVFGLPNPWSYRIGAQTLYYVPLSKTYTHTKRIEPDRGLPAFPEKIRALRETFVPGRFERFGPETDALWEKVKRRHDVIFFRDAARMNWRFVDNPNWSYELLELRTPAGELVGAAVVRPNWLEEPDLAVADWMVDRDVPGAEAGLVRLCEHVARREGMERVRCYLNHMAPESRVFEDMDYDLEGTRFRLVAHSYDPETVTEDHLNRYWYYTLGDFDVV